jgi:hypothetical protein
MTDELDSYEGDEQDGPLWGQVSADEEAVMRKHHLANPDDRPGFVTHGERVRSLRGPDFTGAPGYVAIVQGQVYLVAIILIVQLFLITTGLFELLSGRADILWWIAGTSLVAFLLALLITLWPRKRIAGGLRTPIDAATGD